MIRLKIKFLNRENKLADIFEIIIVAITIIITLSGGIIELRLNPTNWLNRWFALFFFSASLGFLAYSIYHLITCSGCEPVITSIAILAQFFFNFISIALVMTVFTLEKTQKEALSAKYLGTLIVFYLIMSLGYFIWYPTPDPVLYLDQVVDTTTPHPWFDFVNLFRIGIVIYALFKYAMIIRRTEGKAKIRIEWFFAGISIVVIGLIINYIGGYPISDIYQIETFALISFNLGGILILKGLFM